MATIIVYVASQDVLRTIGVVKAVGIDLSISIPSLPDVVFAALLDEFLANGKLQICLTRI